MRKSTGPPLIKALIAKLLAATGVKAIVSTRVRPGVAENETLPYITVSLLPEIPHHGIGYSEPDSVIAKAQITAFDRTYHDALDLAGEVSKALDGENLTVTGWGTSRMTGVGLPVLPVSVKGVTTYMAPRRITALLGNVDTQ